MFRGIDSHWIICRILDGFVDDGDSVNLERINIGYDYSSNRIIPMGNACTHSLDKVGPRSFVKIYCACGKIVDLDKKKIGMKKSLKKNIECTSCRNARISKEIDIMNEHFDGFFAEDDQIY